MNRLIKYFRKNYKMLMSSFILSFILWFAVTTDKEYTYKIEIPLKINRVAKDRVLMEIPPEKALVEVRGKGRSLFSLYFYNPEVELELPEVDHSTTIHLKDYINHFNLPMEFGVHIVDVIEPKNIEIRVDKVAEFKKYVNVRSIIKTQPGYILMSTIPSIDSVLVTGPISLITQIQEISTDTFTVENIKYPFKRKQKLISPNPAVVHLEPAEIEVNYIIEQLVERKIYNIPIQFVGLPDNLLAESTPAMISLKVKGGESIIAAITPDEISATFNFTKNYKVGKIKYPVEIETPGNVSWLEASPQFFELKLKKKESIL
ncbi:MAG: YbbR-like domain-containing protein [Calditrichaceae bacterium]